MKTEKINGVDYVLLTQEQYNSIIEQQKYYDINGNIVNIQIPFKDNRCVNWSDQNNELDYCGIIYKDEKITLGQLIFLRDISNSTHDKINKFIKCHVKFDGLDLNIKEIERIIDKILSFKTQEKYEYRPTFKRELKISI